MIYKLFTQNRKIFFWIPPHRLAAKGVPRNDGDTYRHCEERSNLTAPPLLHRKPEPASLAHFTFDVKDAVMFV